MKETSSDHTGTASVSGRQLHLLVASVLFWCRPRREPPSWCAGLCLPRNTVLYEGFECDVFPFLPTAPQNSPPTNRHRLDFCILLWFPTDFGRESFHRQSVVSVRRAVCLALAVSRRGWFVTLIGPLDALGVSQGYGKRKKGSSAADLWSLLMEFNIYFCHL